MSIFSKVFWKIKLARVIAIYDIFIKEARRIAIAVVIVQFILAGGYWYGVSKGWNEYFGKKTTIIEVAKANNKPEEPKKEVEEPKTRIDRLVDTIYIKESSNGRANYSKCQAINKVNRIGYGIPGNGDYMCFDSPREELETLRKWIEKRIAENLTDNELLCYYNTGAKSNNCKYIQ